MGFQEVQGNFLWIREISYGSEKTPRVREITA
jgi:hypothetical protein